MKIYTSYFSKCSQLKKHNVTPVCIAVGIPKWFDGQVYAKLMPRYEMLSMNAEKYRKKYFEILGRLSAGDVVKELEKMSDGKDVAILCYEKEPCKCHRGIVALWLTEETGMEIEEFKTEAERYEQQTFF